ncbi:MAG: HupE/UreJ family protein [Marinobacter sp.]|nr:HupE/UreJ family protein [Marinobacter sp.]
MTQPNRWLFVLVAMLASCPVWAHKSSDSFIYLDQRTPGATTLRVDMALRDLALVVALDRNGDQQVSGAELRQARSAITRYFGQGIQLASAGGSCHLNGLAWGLSHHSDGPYAAARYAIDCPNGEPASSLTYTLLFDVDPQHRGLVQQRTAQGEQLAVVGPDQPTLTLTQSQPSLLSTFAAYLQQGIIHLLLGYDHILFLLVLILPSSLPRPSSTESQGERRLGRRLLELTGIVTSFTLAHSVTLALSALNVIRPPSALIETLIALSIAVTAINVFWPVLGRRHWRLAFGFGLIHGFGFASVLADLTSGTSQKVLALAGFNSGVEIGQLMVLGVIFPLLYWLGNRPLYQRAAVPLMALAVTLISLYWVLQRAPGIWA